jgi:hypothetical protein
VLDSIIGLHSPLHNFKGVLPFWNCCSNEWPRSAANSQVPNGNGFFGWAVNHNLDDSWSQLDSHCVQLNDVTGNKRSAVGHWIRNVTETKLLCHPLMTQNLSSTSALLVFVNRIQKSDFLPCKLFGPWRVTKLQLFCPVLATRVSYPWECHPTQIGYYSVSIFSGPPDGLWIHFSFGF